MSRYFLDFAGAFNKVLIIGDVMLDQYFSGTVDRISPEAPVPIVKINKISNVLGGAANVANNIASLEGKAGLISTIGDDEAGHILLKEMDHRGIEVSGIHVSSEYKTIKKVRVVGNGQQISRLDYNDSSIVSDSDFSVMLDSFNRLINHYDIVVISDYAKGICQSGFCRQIINKCQENKKFVLIDPKGKDWSKYIGATVITPNLSETSQFINKPLDNNDADILENCSNLCEILQISNLLITRSDKGMTHFDNHGNIKHFVAKAKEVYDVSGAGDTVIAVLSLYFNCFENLENAILLANVAAGIVVGKKGTATLTIAELEEQMELSKPTLPEIKIHSLETVCRLVEKWRNNNERIAFTNGCFDLFHKGHAFSLFHAASFADHLIVAINSDKSVKKLKGDSRPLNSEYDRACVVASIECVDAVLIFDEETPLHILSLIQPDVLVKSGDYQLDEIVGREFASETIIVPYLDGYSTTKLINKLGKN